MSFLQSGFLKPGFFKFGFFQELNVTLGPPQLDQIPNFTVKANSGSYTFDLSVYFSGATSYSITALDTGITFNTGTGVLTVNSGTASVGTHGPITVTASDGTHTTPSNPFTVRISNSTLSHDQRDYIDA